MLRAIEGRRRTGRTSLAWLCENCGEPTSLVHMGPGGEKLCGPCLESIMAIRAALRTYRHQELRERIRVQRVLAREGIAGYDDHQ